MSYVQIWLVGWLVTIISSLAKWIYKGLCFLMLNDLEYLAYITHFLHQGFILLLGVNVVAIMSHAC